MRPGFPRPAESAVAWKSENFRLARAERKLSADYCSSSKFPACPANPMSGAGGAFRLEWITPESREGAELRCSLGFLVLARFASGRLADRGLPARCRRPFPRVELADNVVARQRSWRRSVSVQTTLANAADASRSPATASPWGRIAANPLSLPANESRPRAAVRCSPRSGPSRKLSAERAFSHHTWKAMRV